ncbi:hypothetical protein TA3x_005483 [Tundrisphaera sp. TA3]|uniref:hypothetical protein n=1 Tax=Tundrisphaera sp. TA3 TaxID=3435775 RepID=UPI003EBF22D0
MQQDRKRFSVGVARRDVSCLIKTQGLRWWLFLGLSFLGSAQDSSTAADGPTLGMPLNVERLIRWLPEDTETLVVARNATLTINDAWVALKWPEIGVANAIYDLDVHSHKSLEPLLGKKIDLIVRGGRNYEGVSSFGSLRSESSTILLFPADLGDAGRKLIEAFRKNAKSVRTILNREVYVFPSPIKKEPWVKKTTWEGAYFVLLKPDTLLYATSDRYLEEVLRRVNDDRGIRALPDDLPEWKYVNFAAPAWVVRHFPKGGRDVRAIGMTAALSDQRFQVIYVPKPGDALDSGDVYKQWFTGSVPVTPQQREKFKLESRHDGTISFSTSAPPDIEADMLIWFWQCTRPSPGVFSGHSLEP